VYFDQSGGVEYSGSGVASETALDCDDDSDMVVVDLEFKNQIGSEENVRKSDLKERKTEKCKTNVVAVTFVTTILSPLVCLIKIGEFFPGFGLLKLLKKLAVVLAEVLNRSIEKMEENIWVEYHVLYAEEFNEAQVPKVFRWTYARLLDNCAVALQIADESKRAFGKFSDEIDVLSSLANGSQLQGSQLRLAREKLAAANMNAVKECCKLGDFDEAGEFLQKMRDTIAKRANDLQNIEREKPYCGEALKFYADSVNEKLAKCVSENRIGDVTEKFIRNTTGLLNACRNLIADDDRSGQGTLETLKNTLSRFESQSSPSTQSCSKQETLEPEKKE
jgi:hypothetical protein